MRFRAWGCPHLIAAAEMVCERFTGETVESLARFEPQRLMTMLAVPVEKSGRILLLEDALRLLYRAATGNKVDS
jgi:NifU-like protein involved in Fe-S cluster formation